MDISHADRATAARSITKPTTTDRDAVLIANVLRAKPVDGIDRWLALGSCCPYWANQVRERAGWIAEIKRQSGEVEGTE